METEIRASVETVLRMILQAQPISRAEIAKRSGLSKVTVSQCAEWLLERNAISESEAAETRRGRPPVMLSVNCNAGVIVAIEVDKITSKIGVSDLNGTLLYWEALPPIEEDPAVFLQSVSRHLHDIGRKYEDRPLGILAVAFAMIGSFNQKSGIIEYIANHASWNAYPFQMKLQELCPGLPIFVWRPAQMSAVGEAVFGSGSGFGRLACLSSSWGTGVGICGENGVSQPEEDFFTRFGHTTLCYNGRRCTCGNRGCLEEYVSVRTLFRQLYPNEAPDIRLFYDLRERAKRGDAAVSDALEEMLGFLAVGVSNVINAYLPTQVCISGLLGELVNEDAICRVTKQVETMVPPAYRPLRPLRCSALGELSVLYGCFAGVRESLASLVTNR